MANDDPALRYGVEGGLSGLAIILGVATNDKELTRKGFEGASSTIKTVSGTAPVAETAPSGTFEPPRDIPGAVKPPTAVEKAGPTVAPAKRAAFDPFTLEPIS